MERRGNRKPVIGFRGPVSNGTNEAARESEVQVRISMDFAAKIWYIFI